MPELIFFKIQNGYKQDVNSEQKIIQIAIDQHNDTGTTSVAVKHLSCIRVDNLQALGCTELAID